MDVRCEMNNQVKKKEEMRRQGGIFFFIFGGIAGRGCARELDELMTKQQAPINLLVDVTNLYPLCALIS